jgi:hypothetical protein
MFATISEKGDPKPEAANWNAVLASSHSQKIKGEIPCPETGRKNFRSPADDERNLVNSETLIFLLSRSLPSH